MGRTQSYADLLARICYAFGARPFSKVKHTRSKTNNDRLVLCTGIAMLLLLLLVITTVAVAAAAASTPTAPAADGVAASAAAAATPAAASAAAAAIAGTVSQDLRG